MGTQVQVSMAGWVLCMTLVLAALAGVLGETRYQKFLRQHVDNPRTSIEERQYCNTMMRRRRINDWSDTCKFENTFVHAPDEELKDACFQPLYRNPNYYRTERTLSITYCKERARNMRPPCRYTTTQLQQRVVVACVNGLPVHLAKN